MRKLIGALLILCSYHSLAFAGFYMGGQGAYVKASSLIGVIDPVVAPPPPPPPVPPEPPPNCDDDDYEGDEGECPNENNAVVFGPFVGYHFRINRYYFALEIQQFFDHAQPKAKAVGMPPALKHEVDLRELNSFNFYPGFFFSPNAIIFLQLAVANTQLRVRQFVVGGQGFSLNLERSKYQYKFKYGIGVNFLGSDRWMFRVMYTYLDFPHFDFVDPNTNQTYTVRGSHVKYIYLSFIYTFGEGSPIEERNAWKPGI